MSRCDGERTLDEIIADLERTFGADGTVRRRHRIRVHGRGEEMAGDPRVSERRHHAATSSAGPPLWLLLELTYRCPLHCVYCSNPTEFARTGQELGTDDWLRVLREARALGAVQLGLSGGEPLCATIWNRSWRRRMRWASTRISSPPASDSTNRASRR